MNTVQSKYKRGDISSCGTKRFWAYQAFVKKDGNRTESWIPTHRYEAHKEMVSIRDAKNDAIRDWMKTKPKS